MADAATAGQGLERPDIDLFDPTVATVAPTDTGGAIVDFNGPQAVPPPELTFDADLSPLFTEQAIGRLGTDICQLVEQDERSRSDWRETYSKGLKLLGLKYETR